MVNLPKPSAWLPWVTSQAPVALVRGGCEAEYASPALWELFAYLEGEKWTGKQEWLNNIRLFICKYAQSCGVRYARTRWVGKMQRGWPQQFTSLELLISGYKLSHVIGHINTSCPSWHCWLTDWALPRACLNTCARQSRSPLSILKSCGLFYIFCSRGWQSPWTYRT